MICSLISVGSVFQFPRNDHQSEISKDILKIFVPTLKSPKHIFPAMVYLKARNAINGYGRLTED